MICRIVIISVYCETEIWLRNYVNKIFIDCVVHVFSETTRIILFLI